MRNFTSLVAVAVLAVIATLVIARPSVVQGAAPAAAAQSADRPKAIVTIDPTQLPLPVALTESVIPSTLVVVAAADLAPYQERKTFNWLAAPCDFGGQACEISFSAVPAGHRLVIDNVSGELVTNSERAVRTVRLSSATMSWHVPAPMQSTFANATTSVVNSQMVAYFEAGQIPKVFINTDAVNLGFNNELTLTGHFVRVD
jgi:hypothetical protein